MITTTLAAFPSPAQGVWHLGPIPIRAYAMCIIVGIIAALLIGDRRWAARGGERGVIYDIALWAVPFGLIGGRLYHVMTDWRTYFGPGGAGPAAALRIWDGGLGIWGAVALGAVGAWIGCRRRGIPLPAFGDAIAPGIVLAQAIGRLGNYFNQELYGRETDVPWGMEIFYRRDPSGIIDVHSLNGVSTGEVAAVVHPTFLYELLWNLLVFVLLILIDRWWRIGHGRLFASYVALYCVGRFCVELLRDDTATHLAGIRINSYTSVFVFLGAVVYIMLAPKGREDPSLLRGRDTDDDELLAPELADELVAVAGTTGVIAAAKVAGAEDSGYEDEAPGGVDIQTFTDPDPVESDEAGDGGAAAAAEPEIEQPGESEAEPVDVESVTAGESDETEAETEVEDASETEVEDAAEPDDEAIVEAEAAGQGVEVETAAEVEETLIDDEHDPVDDPEFEEFLGEDDGGETALPDVSEPSDEPTDSAPEGIDAAIDEAIAIEQVTDSADGEPADQIVNSGDSSTDDSSIVIVDPVESDASMVIVQSDTEQESPDASMLVITDSETDETSSDDQTVEDEAVDDEAVEDEAVEDDEPGETAPVPEDATAATPGSEGEAAAEDESLAVDESLADDEAAAEDEVVETETPSTDAVAGDSQRGSRLSRLFRRER